jgi:hypothetical protein
MDYKTLCQRIVSFAAVLAIRTEVSAQPQFSSQVRCVRDADCPSEMACVFSGTPEPEPGEDAGAPQVESDRLGSCWLKGTGTLCDDTSQCPFALVCKLGLCVGPNVVVFHAGAITPAASGSAGSGSAGSNSSNGNSVTPHADSRGSGCSVHHAPPEHISGLTAFVAIALLFIRRTKLAARKSA